MRIDSSGRVGIGTSSPDATLQVVRATSQTDIDGVNQVATFLNTSSDTSGNLTGIRLRQDNVTNAAQGFIGLSSTGNSATRANLVIATPNTSGNSTERLRIDSSGKLLLNTTSAANYIFNAIAKTTQGGLFKTEGLGARDAFPLACWHNATTGDNLFVDFNTETSITSRGYIDYNRASGLVRYGTTSDATLKNIIGDTSGDESLNILRNTKIRDFTWKERMRWRAPRNWCLASPSGRGSYPGTWGTSGFSPRWEGAPKWALSGSGKLSCLRGKSSPWWGGKGKKFSC